MSDEVVVIHMAGRAYARDGATAFVEVRSMIAPSCGGTEDANIGLMKFEV